MSRQVDSLDLEIIELLKDDSRKTKQEIADKLRKARPTVQNRIKALEENDIIKKYTIVTNDKKLGYNVTALILVALDRAERVWGGTAKELWDHREELGIEEMHHIAGEMDVAIKMKIKNIDTLEENLADINKIDGVARTHTLVCLSSYEHGEKI